MSLVSQVRQALDEGKPRVWYHGTKHRFDSFSYEYVLTEDAKAQFGPGFYLTDSQQIAAGYAGAGGVIKEVTLKRLNRIFTNRTKARPNMANQYVAKIPEEDRETVLSNWDEDPQRARRKLIDAINEYCPTLHSMIEMICHECFRGSEPFFVQRVAERSEVDGIIIPQTEDMNFLIAYNPAVLRITKVTAYEDWKDEQNPE